MISAIFQKLDSCMWCHGIQLIYRRYFQCRCRNQKFKVAVHTQNRLIIEIIEPICKPSSWISDFRSQRLTQVNSLTSKIGWGPWNCAHTFCNRLSYKYFGYTEQTSWFVLLHNNPSRPTVRQKLLEMIGRFVYILACSLRPHGTQTLTRLPARVIIWVC